MQRYVYIFLCKNYLCDAFLTATVYANGKAVCNTYELKEKAQTAATAFLASVELNVHSWEMLESRWSVTWSKNTGKSERIMFQWCITVYESSWVETYHYIAVIVDISKLSVGSRRGPFPLHLLAV